MLIIEKTPNLSGAYPSPSEVNIQTLPDTCALIPDTVDMTDFYKYNGFVILTIEAIEHTRSVEKLVQVEKTREVNNIITNENGDEELTSHNETYYEDEMQIVDEVYTTDTVTGYIPNVEAWEAWKEEYDNNEVEDSTPAPTQLDQVEAQSTYTAMMTDTLLTADAPVVLTDESPMFNKVSKWYNQHLWTPIMIVNAVKKNIISAEEYTTITGNEYIAE